MSRKRTIDAPSCSRDAVGELSEPLVKMRRPLRKSQSLRAMAAPVVALARQLAESNAEHSLDREASKEVMLVEMGAPGADVPEEVEKLADEVRVVAVRDDSRISILDPTFQQKVIYGAAFKLHFGVSEGMASFLDDFLAFLGPPLPEPMNISMKKMMHDAHQRFGHTKFFYCNPCDSRLGGSKAVCVNPECESKGLFHPKRCKAMKRTAIHFLQVEPQLSLILDKVLPTLIRIHREIHCGEIGSERSETTSFPWYKRSIETLTEFDERKMKIILTLNFDGVKLKKLSRSEAWPIYMRLEGLPFKEKNKIENVLLAGITFTRKAPTEKLLTEMFGRLREELEMLSENGIPVSHNGTTSCSWAGARMSGIKYPACNANADELPAAIAEAYRTSVDSATNDYHMEENQNVSEERSNLSTPSNIVSVTSLRECAGTPSSMVSSPALSAHSVGSQELRNTGTGSENNDIAAEELLHYQSTSQSRAPTRPWLLQAVMRTVAQSDEISLEQLREAMSHFDIGEEYNEFITRTVRGCRVNVEETKLLQMAAANVQQSSDSVVRSLVAVTARLSDAIVGMAVVIDSLMVFTKQLHGRYLHAEAVASKHMDPKLPTGTFLRAQNLTKQWAVRESYPFKACNPVHNIQEYTYRASGKYQKKPNLKDLPADVAESLIGCCLDGLNLYAPELDASVEELSQNPTSFWLTLGDNDTARARALRSRKDMRLCWAAILRGALARAMADIRQYVPKHDRLVPRPKRQFADSSRPEQTQTSHD